MASARFSQAKALFNFSMRRAFWSGFFRFIRDSVVVRKELEMKWEGIAVKGEKEADGGGLEVKGLKVKAWAETIGSGRRERDDR